MLGSFSIGHWLIVLLIVALVFGTRKLRDLGSDLGSAIKGFKEGLRDGAGRGDGKGDGRQAVRKVVPRIEGDIQSAAQARDAQECLRLQSLDLMLELGLAKL